MILTRKNSLKIYPNPVSKNVTISIDGLPFNAAATIQIRNIESRIILNQHFISFNSTRSVDVSQFREGTYFIKIITDNKVFNEQMLVIH